MQILEKDSVLLLLQVIVIIVIRGQPGENDPGVFAGYYLPVTVTHNGMTG